jgi:Leu/Phe-tRNA-protein transferase
MSEDELQRKICYLSPELLEPSILLGGIYPDLEHEVYWSDNWSPEFYRGLARAGFITISGCVAPEQWLLLPELQRNYAVLDWKEVRIRGGVRKLMSRMDSGVEAVRLRLNRNPDAVLEGLVNYHGPNCWLGPPYVALMRLLAQRQDPGFILLGVELHAGSELVAGELGYITGAAYTSLSGFFRRTNRAWNNFGKLQMVLLARELESMGLAFWNMGHPCFQYKEELGARTVPRGEFLERWLPAVVAAPPEIDFGQGQP